MRVCHGEHLACFTSCHRATNTRQVVPGNRLGPVRPLGWTPSYSYESDMIQSVLRASLASAATLMLTACSAATDVEEQQPSQAEFRAEEKRVAQALSIGRNVERTDATPQYEAMLCNLALEAIGERLENTDLLTSEQIEVFEKAKAIYQNRASVGLTTEESEKTRNDVEAAYPQTKDRARFAIGCLRDLV